LPKNTDTTCGGITEYIEVFTKKRDILEAHEHRLSVLYKALKVLRELKQKEKQQKKGSWKALGIVV